MNLKDLWVSFFGRVPQITPEDLRRWLVEDRRLQLLDARTRVEYARGTLPGALHVPLAGVPEALEGIVLDDQIPVVALCLSGHRSRPHVRLLRQRGVEAYSLKGGLMAWRRAGFRLVEPDGARPGAVQEDVT